MYSADINNFIPSSNYYGFGFWLSNESSCSGIKGSAEPGVGLDSLPAIHSNPVSNPLYTRSLFWDSRGQEDLAQSSLANDLSDVITNIILQPMNFASSSGVAAIAVSS